MRATSHALSIGALVGACLLATPSWGLDLVQAYQAALANDATFASVRSNYIAGLEKLPQARAGLMPVVNGSGNRTETTTTRIPGTRLSNTTYAVQLTQPLFRWNVWQNYEQSKLLVEISEIQLELGRQDLILRLSQAYFDVLAAQDNITFIGAQKAAIFEQLESAKRNFEIGTATITDTYEAQARYDLADAQGIQAQADLEVRISALQQIVGAQTGSLAMLPPAVQIPGPQPAKVNEWIDRSREQNWSVIQAGLNTEVADRNIQIAKSGHYPTLDLVATVQRAEGLVGNVVIDNPYTTRAVGVQVQVPIFAGFAVQSRVNEATALYDRSRNDLEVARRAAVQNTRVAYQGVSSGLAQIRALEAAQVSSRSSLEANKTGYEVGVRINIDVLNAQQQLYSTERDLAAARYNALLSGLRLKAAAGVLSGDDVTLVNQLLR